MSWSPKVNANLPKGTIGGVLNSIAEAIQEHKLRKQLEESTDPDVQALKPYMGAMSPKELIPFIVKGKLFKEREAERTRREEEKRAADAVQRETELRNQARKEIFVARKKTKIKGIGAAEKGTSAPKQPQMTDYFQRFSGGLPQETNLPFAPSQPMPSDQMEPVQPGISGEKRLPPSAGQPMPGPRPPFMVPPVMPSAQEVVRKFQKLAAEGHDLTPQLEALRRKDPAMLADLHLTSEEADAILAAFLQLQGGMGQFSLPAFGQGR